MEKGLNLAVSDIIEWDVKNWSTALDYWLKESLQNLSTCTALEIGSRNGGLSLWLAMQGCRVICSDLEGPTDKAKELHQKYGVQDLIEYRSVDATDIPLEDNSIDLVVFKSVLGGIGYGNNKEAQIKAINEMYRVLKPGGELFFAENLIASPIHKALRKRFVNWGNSWRYPSISEIKEFLYNFSCVYYLTTGFLGTLGRSESQRNILGNIDSIFSNRIIPERWRYIVVGVARK
ncbi:class I SAM-dependent methyltransferase [Clostridium thermarum]|uniref:class I SAM-dependent methyltransferase n=1 Tax=Clostridium thermarum TaxID=1716543 RepID=UPI00111F04FE|nr:class I SAM-dependent methyltransferase [Clostridium thermarum]